MTALVDTVHAKSGDDGQTGEGGAQLKGQATRRAKQEKHVPQRSSIVPSHMLGTDVSRVKQATQLFKDFDFCILFYSNLCWFQNRSPDQVVVQCSDVIQEFLSGSALGFQVF